MEISCENSIENYFNNACGDSRDSRRVSSENSLMIVSLLASACEYTLSVETENITVIINMRKRGKFHILLEAMPVNY